MKTITTIIILALSLALGGALGVHEASVAGDEKQLCCTPTEGDELFCVSRAPEEDCPERLIPICTFDAGGA